MRDSCKSHNSFNQRQAKLASAGMLQSLWFWFSGLYRAAKTRLFWRAFLLYVSHLRALSAFFLKGKASLQWSLFCLSFIPCLCQQAAVETAGTGSLFCFDNLPDWVTALLLLHGPLCWRPFYWFLIKSHDSGHCCCTVFINSWALVIVTLPLMFLNRFKIVNLLQFTRFTLISQVQETNHNILTWNAAWRHWGGEGSC